MKIKIEEIKAKPISISVEESADGYPALSDLNSSGECEFITPVRIDLTALREYDHIRVDGHVATRVRLHCSRCLEEFETDIASAFTVFYNKTSGVPLDAETELTEEDLLSVSYEGDSIDFSREIEDQVIMGVPFKPLCREECRGLCSKCGANLNAGECDCAREEPSFKFGVLKDFKVNK